MTVSSKSSPSTNTTTTTAKTAAPLLLPASRLAVVCDYEAGTVLREMVVGAEPAARSDDKDATAAAGPRLEWGGMVGGAVNRCDDWDRHQVVVGITPSSSAGSSSEISSRNSVARAVSAGSTTSPAGASLNPFSDGFGFAVWLSLLPDDAPTNAPSGFGIEEEEEAPVLTLGRRPQPALFKDGEFTATIPNWKDCGELYDLELSHRAAYREFVLRYSDVDGGAVTENQTTTPHDQASQRICRTLRISTDDVVGPASASNDTDSESTKSSSTLHLAVLWTPKPETLTVYGQGRAVRVAPLQQSLVATMSQWNADESHLVLFRGGSFGGGLHQADFFVPPNVPNSDQVLALYQEGFVKAHYSLLSNRTDSNKESNAWVQLDPLKAPLDASRRIPQDSTTPLGLAVGGMVRWKRNISAFQDSMSTVPLDDSEMGRRFALWVNVTRLPTHGVLSMSNSSSIIDRVASVLVAPLPIQQVSAASLALDYTLTDREFFNLPDHHETNREVSERLEATISVVWKGEVLASSSVVIPIQVQQVNSRPPVLTAPAQLTATLQNGSFLSNVSLHDPDSGSGSTPVRVDVASQHSSLELAFNNNGDDELSFMYETCRQRSESPWQCVGGDREEGATAGRIVTFVAPMEDVPRVLRSMVRVNLFRESDTISIQVYDGQDDMNCLSAREHAMYGSNWTLHRGCFMVNADVELVADPSSVKTGAAGGGGSDTSSISRVANLLFWGLTILLVLGIVACLRRCMPRCLARGTCCGSGTIDADDGADPSRTEDGDVSSPIARSQNAKDMENASPVTLDTSTSDEEFDDVASF